MSVSICPVGRTPVYRCSCTVFQCPFVHQMYVVSWYLGVCVCVCVCVIVCVCVCVCVSHRCLSSTATQYRWTTNRAAPAYSVWRIWCTRWTLVSLLEEGSTARQETTLPTDNSTIPKLMYSRRGIANMANVAQLTDSPWST